MDRVGLRVARHPDDVGDGEIGGDRAEAFADLISLVGLEAVEGELVLFGKDGDGRYAKLGCGAKNADRNLGAVGDKDLPDRRRSHEAPRKMTGKSCISPAIVQCKKKRSWSAPSYLR